MKAMRSIIYPFVLIFVFIAYYTLTRVLDFAPETSSILSVILGAFWVTLFEFKIPYRSSWAPKKKELYNDALYMIFIQILLPRLIAFIAAITLLNYLEARDLTLSLWPHSLPLILQVVIMMLISDFFRYWVHRAHHKYTLLWRLHAIHHSPKKLYWLNVGRFHPLEKILQFVVETLPFLLIGISGEVIALYFVFYAVNGFFQHCNIDLRLGFLNYVISGPELHHWHHSLIRTESGKNFGNNLIIWDLAFGTWFLPEKNQVGELGIPEEDYPTDFVTQQSAPFKHRGY